MFMNMSMNNFNMLLEHVYEHVYLYSNMFMNMSVQTCL
nr:protein [Spodoptera litura nucleopolyhedrovirus]